MFDLSAPYGAPLIPHPYCVIAAFAASRARFPSPGKRGNRRGLRRPLWMLVNMRKNKHILLDTLLPKNYPNYNNFCPFPLLN